jgi:ABC-type sulfate/molybdate transport systems ATPase subunit
MSSARVTKRAQFVSPIKDVTTKYVAGWFLSVANIRRTRIVVDFQYRKGTFSLEVNEELSATALGLHGCSGSGKSTFLKVIAGIEQPERGFIRIADDVSFDSARKIYIPYSQRNVGYVPQCEGGIDLT